MKLQFYDDMIPGTKLKRADMDGATGLEFLKKVFFINWFIEGISSFTFYI